MKRKAFVYGITDYQPPSVVLEAAVPEAERWADLLRNQYDFQPLNLTIRRNASVTLETVRTDIEGLLSGAAPNDLLVIVFCGHGTIVDIGGRLGDEALVLYHAKDVSPKTSAFTDSELAALVRAARPPADARITLILDCCYAGGFAPVPFEEQFHDGFDVEAKALFVQLLSNEEIAQLATVHRFGGLWDKGVELATVEPLVVAACEQARRAAQLPVKAGQQPHLLFSSKAIPALQAKPNEIHEKFIRSINPLSSDQRATLQGNVPRRAHPFLT